MADDDQDRVWRIYVSEEMNQRWGHLNEDDYRLFMAEYARLEFAELKTIEGKINLIQKRVNSIQGWVVFFGVLAILSLIGSLCWFIFLFPNLGYF